MTLCTASPAAHESRHCKLRWTFSVTLPEVITVSGPHPFVATGAGETEEQHRELVGFARDFAFERMGAFAYSAEDGTSAASMAEQVRGVVATLADLPGRVGWVCTA